MRKTFMAIAAISIGVASSASAQSLLDNLRSLKGSVEGLVGSNRSADAEARSNSRGASVIGADGTVRYDVGSFDVAGIRLGMTPSEVRVTMQEKGFSVAETAEAERLTFAGLAKTEASRLMQTASGLPSIAGPSMVSGTDSGRNRLAVDFLQTRAGPVVSHIKLTFDRSTNDVDRLEADLASRYGQPSRKMLGSYGSHWCSVGGVAKCEVLPDPAAPKLSYSDSILTTLTLTNHQAMKARRDAEIAALFDKPTGERQRSLLGS
ncbi:hypothetical protein AAG604_04100 [Citromicrobium bathyomarinum]